MYKEYQKPEVEVISLLTLEKITTEEDIDEYGLVDGSMGIGDSIFG